VRPFIGYLRSIIDKYDDKGLREVIEGYIDEYVENIDLK
jgi:hypothetical protein